MDDVDYFIKKFEAIPEKEWCTGVFRNKNDQRCALGHCGAQVGMVFWPQEARKYSALMFEYYKVQSFAINDGIVDGQP